MKYSRIVFNCVRSFPIFKNIITIAAFVFIASCESASVSVDTSDVTGQQAENSAADNLPSPTQQASTQPDPTQVNGPVDVPVAGTNPESLPDNSLATAPDNSQDNAGNIAESIAGAEIRTGIFLDSPVANLAYRTESIAGFTDGEGSFNYLPDENIVFSIGNVELPSTTAKSIITPLDLFPDGAIDNRGVVNVSRLLQSLDEDNEAANGIVLSDNAHTLLTVQPLDFESTSFSEAANTLIEASGASGSLLIPATAAMEHLAITLNAEGLAIPVAENGGALMLRDSNSDGIPDEFDWDDDGDGVNDELDLFPYDSSEQFDFDGDGIGNNADTDDDNDGVEDSIDAFPNIAGESRDTDQDGIGDNSDTDIDNDGVANNIDAFPFNSDEQFDHDGDGIGNNADLDDDNDGVVDTQDLFALSADEQADADGDGVGDRADTDDDNDGVADTIDLFPLDHTEHSDFDRDGIGNNADTDDDNDGFPDNIDAFPFAAAENADSDNDGIGDNADTDDDNDGTLDTVDAFLLNAQEQQDFDGDGIGNSEDTDDDDDGVEDTLDAFPYLASESQDTDQDGIGDNSDVDIDNDGVRNNLDKFPLDSTEQFDYDEDGIGNNADTDDDNDGVIDAEDLFPLAANEHSDADGDGTGDQADEDDDNDGVPDVNDLFPLDNTEYSDFDGDGIGNNADTDDDNDGVADSDDAFPFADTEHSDNDNDGIGDNVDVDDDNDGVQDSTDAFPLNAEEHQDSDLDGIGDNTDTDDDGDGIPDESDPDSVVLEPNTPPQLTVPDTLSFSYIANGVATAEVTDAENNAVALSWSVNSSPPSGDMLITRANLNFTIAQFNASVAGLYEIGIRVTDGIDDTYGTFTVEVTNSPPIIPDIFVVPPSLPQDSVPSGTADTSIPLFARHEQFSDPDGPWESHKYTWTVNDVEVAGLESYQRLLVREHFKRGDIVKVELEVFDGLNTTTAISPGTLIVNAPPLVGLVEMLPAIAGTGDALNISVESFDADGDDIEFTYQWFVNGSQLTDQSDAILPAGIATFGDVVTARVVADDGFDTVTSDPVSITIVDTPSSLITTALPVTLTYGEAATFNTLFSDPDGADVSTVFLDGPQGLSYDSATGAVNWTPTPLMLTDTETYRAQFASSDGQTEWLDIVVSNPDRPTILAKSGIAVPRNNAILDIGDFDGDGKNEILSTDSFDKIFTLELDGEHIAQDWLYPYPLLMNDRDIIGLWSHGLDSSELIVVTGNGVNYIESINQPPTVVYESTDDIETAELADVDSDGIKDLILVNDLGELVVLSTESWQPISPIIALNSDDPYYIARFNVAVGNVDIDPQLEIVTSTGEVIDTTTWTVEWQHSAEFGLHLAIGDIDGDGDNEIVAGTRSSDVTSYDANTQTSIWSYDLQDTCGLAMYNADNDPQDEIFHGPCQHGELEVYDGATGTVVLQEEFDHSSFSSAFTSISFGDMDNDGVDEVVFATGTGSSGADQMGIASIAGLGDTQALVTNNEPAILGSFTVAGWDTTTHTHDHAVFVLPSTDGDTSGQRIGLLSDSGEFSLSDITARNWSRSTAAAVVDSNGDGVSEILVSAGNPYDGQLHHLVLDDFTQIHVHEDLGNTATFGNPDIESIASGIAADGSIKAILSTSQRKLQIYDVASMQSDWTSGLLTGTSMNGAVVINHDAGFDIVAATNSELTLWKSVNGGYSKFHTAGVDCDVLSIFQSDGEPHVACIASDFFGDDSTLTTYNSQLIKQSETELPGSVSAMLDNGDGQLLIANEIEDDNNDVDNKLQLINPQTGFTVWSSIPLVGEITGLSVIVDSLTGGKKLGISTAQAMYIVRQ